MISRCFFNTMDTVTNIRLEISTKDGKHLLSETHNIVHGPEGVLRDPQRLGLVAQDLVCFPSKKETDNVTNKGIPYDVLCASFLAGRGPYIATVLKTADFIISAKSCAYIWARVENPSESLEIVKHLCRSMGF